MEVRTSRRLFGLSKITVFLFLLVNAFSSVVSECVPVYLWKNSRAPGLFPALEIVTEEAFADILKSHASDVPILAFAEESLSPEDFALNSDATVFPFLVSTRRTSKVSYLPCVKDSVGAIEQLTDRQLWSFTAKELLEGTPIALEKNSVVIVDLDDASEYEDRIEMLSRHDAAISSIYKRLSAQNSDVLAVFTGRHSSWTMPEEISHTRHVRAADDKSADNNTGILYKNDNILLYVDSVPLVNISAKADKLENYQIVKNNDTTEGLTVVLQPKGNSDGLSVRFDFSFKSGYWRLYELSVHDNRNNKDYPLETGNLTAPAAFSYHCSSQEFSNKAGNVTLILPGLQIQPFQEASDKNTKFGTADDCVGFMSAPIWSGIFVTFILVLIMTFGLSMIMDIKTMDRFDDPKGKTITINTSE